MNNHVLDSREVKDKLGLPLGGFHWKESKKKKKKSEQIKMIILSKKKIVNTIRKEKLKYSDIQRLYQDEGH